MPAPELTTKLPDHADIETLQQRAAAQCQDEWWQVYLRFTNWTSAERTAVTHLAPHLDAAASPDGAWWFIRKHPDWRIRIRTGPDRHGVLKDAFDQLVDEGVLSQWQTGRYEPETTAFGGPDAMAAAHTLFAADSHALLHPTHVPIGRRELSVLLCSALMRGAALEAYEIGDVWAKVTHDRLLPDDVPPEGLTALTATVTTLLRTDTSPTGAAFGPTGLLTAAASHADAFRACGRALAALARDGALNRGLREVLAYHVIFHWNRAGLDSRQQSLLAHAARAAILGPTPRTRTSPTAARSTIVPRATTAQLDRALRRFPLVARPRLACPPLTDRIQAVKNHAEIATTATDPDERTDHACSAWNLTALIASDSGLPGLAADLSWQQFHLLRSGWPLSGRYAIAALQPLVNLARLHGRARRPERMYQTLTNLGHALEHGGNALIHDTTIALDGLTNSPDDTEQTRTWYRNVLAQDGTRALAATGDWAKAAAHAALYDPAPAQLNEAAQTRIISFTLDGDHDSALAVLNTRPVQGEDEAIDAVLRAYLDADAGRSNHTHLTRLLTTLTQSNKHTDSVRNDTAHPAPVLFRIRLAQVADDLGAARAMTIPVWEQLVEEALQANDGYAALQALKSPTCQTVIGPDRAAALTDLTHRAALNPDTLPLHYFPDLATLTAPLQLAADALTR